MNRARMQDRATNQSAEKRVSSTAKRGPGRPRFHDSDEERKRAHYAETKLLRSQLEDLKRALCEAAEAGRCPDLTNHLPEAPSEWIPELIGNLAGKKLILCKREPKKPKTEQPGDEG